MLLRTLVMNDVSLGEYSLQYEDLRGIYESEIIAQSRINGEEIIVAGSSMLVEVDEQENGTCNGIAGNLVQEIRMEKFTDPSGEVTIHLARVENSDDCSTLAISDSSDQMSSHQQTSLQLLNDQDNERDEEPIAVEPVKFFPRALKSTRNNKNKNSKLPKTHNPTTESNRNNGVNKSTQDKNLSSVSLLRSTKQSKAQDVGKTRENIEDTDADDENVSSHLRSRRRRIKNKYASEEWVTSETPNRKKSCTTSADSTSNQAGRKGQASKQASDGETPAEESEEQQSHLRSEAPEQEEHSLPGEEVSVSDQKADMNSILSTHSPAPSFDSSSEEKVFSAKSISCGQMGSITQWREGVKCPHCIYIGHSATRLEQHLARVHEEDTIYKCRLCDYTCKWNREYYKHMKCHYEGPPYRCEQCDYTCDRIQFILSHRMRHTDERPFHCGMCSFKSRTKGNLIVHMRIHTGEKPFKCQYCGRCFAMKNTLDQHLATHTNERPFSCDTCGFTTKYQSHLLSHKRIHTGNVYRCDVAGCNYSSPRRCQLEAHRRSHFSQRDHMCATCGRGFIEKSHLIRHERIHSGDKPFKCQLCDYASTRRDKLKEHVLKHHSGENSECGSTGTTPCKTRRTSSKRSNDQVAYIEESSLPDLTDGQLIVTSPQEIQLPSSEQDLAAASLIFECTSSFDSSRVVVQSNSGEFPIGEGLLFIEKI